MMPQRKLMIPKAIALLVTFSGSLPSLAQAPPTALPRSNAPIVFNNPEPPLTGRPGRRSDAGSRGCGEGELADSTELTQLLALVPTQETASATVVFGKTGAEHPTFWFYVPHSSSHTASFVLQDQDGNPIYEADVALPQTANILSLTLPETVAPLEIGQPYQWFFKLYCRSTSPPVQFVDGWIQREPLPSVLAQQLQTATPQQQVQLYAANGFWFEALTTAVELRQTNPENSAWSELLRAIGLESVVNEAIASP